MNHKMVFTVQSVFFFLAGLLLLLIPAPLFADLGVVLDAGAVGLARSFGATVIMAGVIAWTARESASSTARTAIVLGFFVGNLLMALVGAFNILTGAVGTLMWAGVAAWALLALDFGVIYFKHGDDA